MTMTLTIGTDREEDGRWIAYEDDLLGVMAYGATEAEAVKAVVVLALQVVADKIGRGEVRAEVDIATDFAIEFHAAPAVPPTS
jgi:predicted RNase H-like HicB family nuclease